MQLKECINFQLTRTQKAVFTYFKNSLAKFDVTPSQYALLSLLWGGNELSPSGIAAELDLDASSITGLINRMEGKGLITRTYRDDDRRTVIIKTAEKGEALRGGINATIEDCNRKVTKSLGSEEKQLLERMLGLLFSNAENLDS